jgi:hypothetical protein
VQSGFELRRDAPRDVRLSREDTEGVLEPVTQHDFTIGTASPYASLAGEPWRFLSYRLGVRDEIFFDNADRLDPARSYRRWNGITSPKGTLVIRLPRRLPLPVLAFS